MSQPRLRLVLWSSGAILALGASLAVGWYNGWFGKSAVTKPARTVRQGTILKPVLATSQREYLWQAEHHHLLLGKHGFQPFAKALSQADSKKLDAFLSPRFTGRDLNHPRVVRLPQNGFAEVMRKEDSGRPATVLDRSQFIARLLEYRNSFSRPPQVKFSVKTLAPVVREKMAGPWQGTCVVRLWDEICKQECTKPSKNARPPVEVLLTLQFQIQQPVETILARGGWLDACAIKQTFVARSKLSRFFMREVAKERGIDIKPFHDNWKSKVKSPITGGVYLCDFNRDGIMDVLVTDLNCYVLYQGLPGGKFKDVTKDQGLPEFPDGTESVYTTAAFVDIDGDGWEDLILGNRIYRNNNGKKFEDYTFRTNLHLPPDTGSITIADFDRDGRIDLYVTRPGRGKADSWLEGKSGVGQGNQLWRNLGNWQFEDVTARSGAAAGQRSTFSAVWFDADNDGWPDLYVINEFGDGVLLVNNKDGTFREQRLTTDPCDFGSMGITCGDIDNDGNIDLYIANMYSKAGMRVFSNLRPDAYPKEVMAKMLRFVTGSQLHRNRGALRFEQRGETYQVHDVGWAYGAALIDLDNDGWLDLFATCGFMSFDRKKQDG